MVIVVGLWPPFPKVGRVFTLVENRKRWAKSQPVAIVRCCARINLWDNPFLKIEYEKCPMSGEMIFLKSNYRWPETGSEAGGGPHEQVFAPSELTTDR